MPISGVVLSLCEPVEAAVALLRREPTLELGPLHGRRLPAVLETASLSESEEVVRSLAAIPGVLFVDVVTVDFEGSLELEAIDAQA